MRIVRLGQVFELKYKLANYQGELGWIKRQVKDAINNYIANPPKAYTIVPQLYQQFKDASCRELIKLAGDIYDNLDSLEAKDLFDKVNSLLALIKKFQVNKSTIRQRIHGYYKKDNDRELAKNKFEQVVFKKLNNELLEVAVALKKRWGIEDAIKGEQFDPQRKELTKQEMWAWVLGHPAAAKYGLNDLDVFGKVYEDPELRHDLTTIVLATKRDRSPATGHEVMEAVREIMEIFRRKQTNDPYFEAGEGVAKEMARPKFGPPTKVPAEERKDFVGPDPGYDPEFVAERNKQEAERLRLQERNRLEEEDRKTKEEEADRHIRSEGTVLLKALIKKRYL